MHRPEASVGDQFWLGGLQHGGGLMMVMLTLLGKLAILSLLSFGFDFGKAEELFNQYPF